MRLALQFPEGSGPVKLGPHVIGTLRYIGAPRRGWPRIRFQHRAGTFPILCTFSSAGTHESRRTWLESQIDKDVRSDEAELVARLKRLDEEDAASG